MMREAWGVAAAASTAAPGSDLEQVVNKVVEEKLAARRVNGILIDLLKGPVILGFLTSCANYPPNATREVLTEHAGIYVGFVLNPSPNSSTKKQIAELPPEKIEAALLSAMDRYNLSKVRVLTTISIFMQREFAELITQARAGYQGPEK